MQDLFQRCGQNPIITADDMPGPCAAVFNPGATEQNGEVVLMLRAENRAGFSDLYVARSKDGVGNWKIDPEPLLAHATPPWHYEDLGCEDARLTYIREEDAWYIAYTAYSKLGPAVAVARTGDFRSVARVGLALSPANKDATLFPGKIDGRYTMLHRPVVGTQEHIWIAYSPDLVHWGEPHCVLPERGGPWWDGEKVGAGPPPIKTDLGWLLIYHGVKMFGGGPVYRVGLALLDKDKPWRPRFRMPGWVFGPRECYECSGIMPNVVFPCGALIRGDELWMYYGAADTCICLATAKLPHVLDTITTAGEYQEKCP